MIEQPEPWPNYNKPGTSPCWIHYCNEKIGRRTYIVCFECGHVWTKYKLRRAWREHFSWKSRLKNPRWCFRRASRIWSCPVCIHDF